MNDMTYPTSETPGVATPGAKSGVCFGLPSLSHKVSLGFLRSWTETIVLLTKAGIDSSTLALGGDPFIAKARSRIATDFLRDCPEADCLFFLDDDVDWPAEKVLEFINRPEPVLAGIYPQKSKNVNFPVELAAYADTGELIENDGLVKALLVPTGFLRIKRWVLEKLAESSALTFLDTMLDGSTKEFLGIFESGIGPKEGDTAPYWWGEDYIFCRKCRVLGIDIWVDPKITMGHVGQKRWEDSIYNHLDTYRSRAKLSVETNPQKQQEHRLRTAIASAEPAN